MAEKKQKPKDTRTAEQIRRDIAAARARVSANVEQLVEEVHPSTIKDRAVGHARSFAQAEINSAKATIKDEAGWRLDRVLAVGAAVVGVVAFLLTVRAIGNSRQRSIARRSAAELTAR